MYIRCIKSFSNGIKACLRTAENGKTSILSIIDKEGCLIAQREVKHGVGCYGGKVLEKTTVRAGKDGTSSMEHMESCFADSTTSWNSLREYSTDGKNIFQNNNGGVYADGIHYFKKDKAEVSDVDWISSCQDKIYKMFGQWFNFRKGTTREISKPINPKTYA